MNFFNGLQAISTSNSHYELYTLNKGTNKIEFSWGRLITPCRQISQLEPLDFLQRMLTKVNDVRHAAYADLLPSLGFELVIFRDTRYNIETNFLFFDGELYVIGDV